MAGILFVGPIALVTSLFPRYAPTAVPDGNATVGRSADVARVLYRTTRVYGALAVSVPAVGLTLAAVQGRLTDTWVLVAMVLTAAAGGLLALRIAPLQKEILVVADRDSGIRLRRIRMLTGIFNVLWVVVVVLMIVRPGAS